MRHAIGGLGQNVRLGINGAARDAAGMKEFEIAPKPDDPALTQTVSGTDQNGVPLETAVAVERPLTIYLNGQEIVTVMTIGDQPEYLAVGYLFNQNMVRPGEEITAIEYEDDVDTVVVRTNSKTKFEEKLRKKTMTSGCAQGTVFGDMLERFEEITLPESTKLRTSDLYALQKKINTQPSLYLKAGAIHGCALCEGDRPLLYVEDVGRHNAVDKIAGYMVLNDVEPGDKIFYTTGRLTSEMIIKCVSMSIPILVSRSGFTAWGVELAREKGLTLIGRARGNRFVTLSGGDRIIYDADTSHADKEDPKLVRKGSRPQAAE